MRRIALVLLAMLALLPIVAQYQASAATTTGFLYGRQGSPQNESSGATFYPNPSWTNLGTDGSLTTSVTLLGTHGMLYDLGAKVTIGSYQIKATVQTTGATTSVTVKLYDENKAEITRFAATGGYVRTDLANAVDNVRYVFIGPATPANSWYLYEADLFGAGAPPPQAPTGLTAVAGDKKVSLSWTPVIGVDGYEVYMNGTKIAGTITSASYDVTGLTNGTSYSFYVKSVAGTVKSAASNTVTATPVAPVIPPPAAPLGLTGTAIGTSAKLTWNANSERDLAGYNLYQDGAKVNSSLIVGTTMTVPNLRAKTTYKYQVTAVNTSGGESAKSNVASVTIPDIMSVNFVPNMDSIIVQISDGSAPYTVTWDLGTDTVNGNKYTITGLQASTVYTVTVTDASGQSITQAVNTGAIKSFQPPTFPSPGALFQNMLDLFGTSGTIAIAIITGAVALGVLCILGIWGWRLSKRWLSASR